MHCKSLWIKVLPNALMYITSFFPQRETRFWLISEFESAHHIHSFFSLKSTWKTEDKCLWQFRKQVGNMYNKRHLIMITKSILISSSAFKCFTFKSIRRLFSIQLCVIRYLCWYIHKYSYYSRTTIIPMESTHHDRYITFNNLLTSWIFISQSNAFVAKLHGIIKCICCKGTIWKQQQQRH